MLHEKYYEEQAKYEKLIALQNRKTDFYNGIFDRYENPVLTRDHIPLTWIRRQIPISWSGWE